VRITDFGLAGFARELAIESQAGTPAFMAPELFAGAGTSTRTDIYSLGAVLYEIFTGQRAFDADSISGLRRLHHSATLTAPSRLVDDLDLAVESVIVRCLEKDPLQRPTSALAVAAEMPGGDPVSAALAAGETPSPEMIAEAGGEGALRPAIAIACFVAAVAGLVLIGALNERVALYRLAPPAKPGVILADRAREILQRLGHETPPVDKAYGFEHYGGFLEHIEKTESSPDRWDTLRERRPPVYWLWYRESPAPLVPANHVGEVRWRDPPAVIPGMANLLLDDQGRLGVLEIVPPQEEDAEPAPWEPLDYAVMFEFAGLDPTDFHEVEPSWNPGTYADERAAWEGHYPGQPDWPLRIEAATYRGQPVYFQVIESFSRASTNRATPGTRMIEPRPGVRWTGSM
jgi:serine/threonine-protein kinase